MSSNGGTTPHPVMLGDIPQIRRIWHQETWYYSVIDVIAYLVKSSTPRKYWNTLKARLKAEGAQRALDEIEALSLRSADGRLRLTDTARSETLLRLIQSIPSPRVEPLKQWLAEVGQERIEEVEHPELVLERIRAGYRAKHREERWIEERIRNGLIRNALTDEWSERGAKEGMEFAILTNELSNGTFGLTVQAHRLYKRLPSRENLRDHMSRMELILCSLSEETAIQLHQEHESQGFSALKEDATAAGQTAGEARRVVEQRLGKPVVSSQNFLEPPGSGKPRNQLVHEQGEAQGAAELSQPTIFDEPPNG